MPHLAFQPDRLANDPILPIGEVETSYYLRMRVAGPAGRAGRRHAHPRRLDDLDRRDGAEGAGRGRAARRHRHAHAPARSRRTSTPRWRRSRSCRPWSARSRASGSKSCCNALRLHPRGARRRSASPRSCSKASPPTAGCTCRRPFRASTCATLARRKRYPELAYAILSLFMDDVAGPERGIVDRTYTKEIFGSDDITPLKTLEPGLHILGLSNGPTLAFKDVALQLLGNLFEYDARAAKQRDAQHPRRHLGRHRLAPPSTRCAARRTSTSSCSRRTAA